MVQSEFSIKTLGVHFGNYVLDNSHWDKISHSLTKKQHLKQSATLFEMKKKKKELQAKSSYPNFGIQVKYILFQTLSKRKLEKKPQKKPKQTQLSICKCGLGILDIDTQLNSLERKWNYRLVKSTYALWKGLMLY